MHSGHGPQDLQHPLSAQDWVDLECRRLLESGLPRVVRTLRPYGLQMVALGGSAALGEAVGWEAEGGRILLSDLDLAAVTADPVPESVRASLTLEGGIPGSGLNLGCYLTRALDRQDPTPGLVDLTSRGVVLWGDPAWLGRFRAPTPGAIPSWEAYRLVGNRCLELEAAEASGNSVALLHALAKAATDLWTAWTLARGAYRSGWWVRSISLDLDPLGAPEEVVRAARGFSPFRLQPAPERLPPEEERESLFPEALRAWLGADPGGFRDHARDPGQAFLREPAGLRNRLVRWRRAWDHPGLIRFGLRLLREGVWESTPEGMRMAGAARRLAGR